MENKTMTNDANNQQIARKNRQIKPQLFADCMESFEPESTNGFRWACGVGLSLLGILILVGSGLCAITFTSSQSNLFLLALAMTAPFFILGLLLWWVGDRLRWRRPK
jgi:hypothetical protein